VALSINHATRVIFVPQADLVPLGGEVYQLDVDAFRLELKDYEDGSNGMALPDTHRHNVPVTLSGVVYSRTFEIINGFTVEFEDGQYTVSCTGANHNLGDVKVVNQVSLIVNNSAGAIDLGTLTDNIAAVKAKTDQLTFTKANEVDVNTKSIRDQAITGSGTEADPWGP
jgi:hypothetical protein